MPISPFVDYTVAEAISRSGNYLWDAGSLAWVKETTASGGGASSSIATAQVSVTGSATLIAAARSTRVSVMVTQLASGTDIYIGASGVATNTGTLLPGIKGASITIPTTAAIYGIVASGSANVSVIESY